MQQFSLPGKGLLCGENYGLITIAGGGSWRKKIITPSSPDLEFLLVSNTFDRLSGDGGAKHGGGGNDDKLIFFRLRNQNSLKLRE